MEASDLNGADAQGQGNRGGKARRARGVKPAEVGKRSLNLRIDDDTYERLTVHAMRKRTTISGLVEALARDHCREFSVHRNGAAAKGEGQGAG